MAGFWEMGQGKNPRERELEKEIRSLELRKEAVFSTINGEIARLQGEQNNIFLSAGKRAYEAWKTDGTVMDLMSFWNTVKDLEAQIAEQENKRTEMGVKYDEEIRLINSNLNNLRNMGGVGPVSPVSPNPSMPPMPPAGAGMGEKCPKCGAPVRDGDLFCRDCGTKVR